MPILLRCTILDILQQQQCKFFLRYCHTFTQRTEADVEDEIYHFFEPERLFASEDIHFVFLYVLRTVKIMYFVSTIKVFCFVLKKNFIVINPNHQRAC